MRRWRPAPSGGSLVGILALLLCASALAGILYRAIPDARGNTPASIIFWGLAAFLIAAIVALGVLVWGYLTLSYTLEEQGDGALELRWAWRRIVIPLDEIEYLGAARQLLTEGASPRLWPWPGYYLSSIRDEALGQIALFATLPPRRQLLVCSARGSFGFSPDRPADFLAQFGCAIRRMGRRHRCRARASRPPPPIWRTRRIRHRRRWRPISGHSGSRRPRAPSRSSPTRRR